MKRLILAFLLLFTVTVVANDVTIDTLDVKTPYPVFRVTFPPVYSWACVRATSTTETIVQEDKTIPYAPASCGPLAPGQKVFVDDFMKFVEPSGEWDVHAELWDDSAKQTDSASIRVKY